jgi:hypothetical protein
MQTTILFIYLSFCMNIYNIYRNIKVRISNCIEKSGRIYIKLISLTKLDQYQFILCSSQLYQQTR